MLSWTKHPVLKPPSEEEMAYMDPKELLAFHRTYHEAIANSNKDPYRYGFVLPHWKHADEQLSKCNTLLLLGANRSSKTSFAARAVVRAAVENDGSLIYAFSQNNEISITVQQAAVYYWLPAELKIKRLGDVENVSYSIANGFSKNKLVLPNGSQIIFKTYTQYQQDNSILEGMELGAREPKWVNIGAWCDEYLLGMELLTRLNLRLATRNAKLLVTFTPKDGTTETVRYYLDGAIDRETRITDCLTELHGIEERPVAYIQENTDKSTGIVYFHSKDNPWSGYERLKVECKGRGDVNYTLTALYGQPTKTTCGGFPLFGAHNIVKPESIDHSKLTRYMCIDPAHARNWFMPWVGIDASGTWFVYDEWPGVNIGKWAEDREGKWQIGEGARKLGYGYEEYKATIASKEVGKPVFQRYIDPRFGASKYSVSHGQSDVIHELDAVGINCIAAPGVHESDGLDKITTLMAYDTSKPIDAGTNRPSFYISENCKNTIASIINYDPLDPGCEALKDPIDCLRYLATAGIMHIDPQKMKPVSRFQGGY